MTQSRGRWQRCRNCRSKIRIVGNNSDSRRFLEIPLLNFSPTLQRAQEAQLSLWLSPARMLLIQRERPNIYENAAPVKRQVVGIERMTSQSGWPADPALSDPALKSVRS